VVNPCRLEQLCLFNLIVLSTDLHNICLAANDKYTQLNLDFKYNDPMDPNHFYERSDHYNFARMEFPPSPFNGFMQITTKLIRQTKSEYDFGKKKSTISVHCGLGTG
jgi:hypothetical protein